MLTADVLGPRGPGGAFTPAWLGPHDHPWILAVLDELRRCAGQPRRAWTERCREPLRRTRPRGGICRPLRSPTDIRPPARGPERVALAGQRPRVENAIERAVVLSKDDQVGIEDPPPALRKIDGGRKRVAFEVGTQLHVVERRMIEETLRYCNGDKVLAASLLGITARTIYRPEAEWSEDG